MPRPWRLTSPQLVENDVEDQCKTILEMKGWKAYRLNAGIFQSLDARRKFPGAPKGTPDYICARGVRCFLLEVKRPGGQLSEVQKAEISYLRQYYGLRVVVVDHVDQLCNFLAEHERLP